MNRPSDEDGVDVPVELEEPIELEEVEVDPGAQVTVHAPAPRANVVEEARTVVVTDETAKDASATQRLRKMEPGRNDPTLVLRAVRGTPSWEKKKKGGSSWVPWLLLGAAAALAFGFGGALALWLAKRDAPSGPSPSATSNVRR